MVNVVDENFMSTIFVHLTNIPMPVWAVGFALEQPLHVVALACPAS
jgi:hypothetical protein